MKTRKEIIAQPYLSITDISILLKISYPHAKAIYEKAKARERTEFHGRRVSIEAVTKVTGITLNTLIKQADIG